MPEAAMPDWTLSAGLSQLLVAFTIELDNEFEHQCPYRTSMAKTGNGPWLASMAMWTNFLRFVPVEGAQICDIPPLDAVSISTLRNQLPMERWGYVRLERTTGHPRDWLIRPTENGVHALEIWRPLPAQIEQRWIARWGEDVILRLRSALFPLSRASGFKVHHLPLLHYGMYCSPPGRELPEPEDESQVPISTLLARVLLAFAVQFESESSVSLAIAANVLRVVGDRGISLRSLPRRAGVSKEAIAMATGWLERHDYGKAVREGPTSSEKVFELTPAGLAQLVAYRARLESIDLDWRNRFGSDTIEELIESIAFLLGAGSRDSSLFLALQPYPDGWRARVPPLEVLPYFPMVLHRGGYPDGS